MGNNDGISLIGALAIAQTAETGGRVPNPGSGVVDTARQEAAAERRASLRSGVFENRDNFSPETIQAAMNEIIQVIHEFRPPYEGLDAAQALRRTPKGTFYQNDVHTGNPDAKFGDLPSDEQLQVLGIVTGKCWGQRTGQVAELWDYLKILAQALRVYRSQKVGETGPSTVECKCDPEEILSILDKISKSLEELKNQTPPEDSPDFTAEDRVVLQNIEVFNKMLKGTCEVFADDLQELLGLSRETLEVVKGLQAGQIEILDTQDEIIKNQKIMIGNQRLIIDDLGVLHDEHGQILGRIDELQMSMDGEFQSINIRLDEIGENLEFIRGDVDRSLKIGKQNRILNVLNLLGTIGLYFYRGGPTIINNNNNNNNNNNGGGTYSNPCPPTNMGDLPGSGVGYR